jgi:hypothetical protein
VETGALWIIKISRVFIVFFSKTERNDNFTKTMMLFGNMILKRMMGERLYAAFLQGLILLIEWIPFDPISSVLIIHNNIFNFLGVSNN